MYETHGLHAGCAGGGGATALGGAGWGNIPTIVAGGLWRRPPYEIPKSIWVAFICSDDRFEATETKPTSEKARMGRAIATKLLPA